MTPDNIAIVELPEGWYVGPSWQPSQITIRSDDDEPISQAKVKFILMKQGLQNVDFALIYAEDHLEFKDFHILILPGGMSFHGRN